MVPYGGSPTANLAHRSAYAGLSGFALASDRAGHAHGPYRTDGRLSSASSSSVVVPSPTASSSGVLRRRTRLSQMFSWTLSIRSLLLFALS